MKKYITLVFNGALMGAANVIPGVSGGTMALLTGIFEPLIDAIKSFDTTALKLLFSRRFKEFAEHTHLEFLIPVGIGIVISILSIARLLEYLFVHQAVYVWSFFFGLILASVYFVGKRIKRFTIPVLGFFVFGTVLAASIAFMEPAAENASFPYLFFCGVVAICSMILPGLSGSYVLLLMGNYQLVMIEGVNSLSISILLPIAIGAGVGLLLFARFLSWVFKKFHDRTVSLLTGFVFGSLAVLWPWKEAVIKIFQDGDVMKEKITGYTYNLPELNSGTLLALAVMAIGVITIIAVETSVSRKETDQGSGAATKV
jgi:putative membrane protein